LADRKVLLNDFWSLSCKTN